MELNFTNRYVDLVAEGYDIAVRWGPLTDSSLIARPLGRGQSGYYASPAYLQRRGKPRSPGDMVRHDCIVFSGSSRGERWQFARGKRVEEIAVNKRIVAASR
jgi:DNA-binding transcriptional LysR family regulator